MGNFNFSEEEILRDRLLSHEFGTNIEHSWEKMSAMLSSMPEPLSPAEEQIQEKLQSTDFGTPDAAWLLFEAQWEQSLNVGDELIRQKLSEPLPASQASWAAMEGKLEENDKIGKKRARRLAPILIFAVMIIATIININPLMMGSPKESPLPAPQPKQQQPKDPQSPTTPASAPLYAESKMNVQPSSVPSGKNTIHLPQLALASTILTNSTANQHEMATPIPSITIIKTIGEQSELPNRVALDNLLPSQRPIQVEWMPEGEVFPTIHLNADMRKRVRFGVAAGVLAQSPIAHRDPQNDKIYNDLIANQPDDMTDSERKNIVDSYLALQGKMNDVRENQLYRNFFVGLTSQFALSGGWSLNVDALYKTFSGYQTYYASDYISLKNNSTNPALNRDQQYTTTELQFIKSFQSIEVPITASVKIGKHSEIFAGLKGTFIIVLNESRLRTSALWLLGDDTNPEPVVISMNTSPIRPKNSSANNPLITFGLSTGYKYNFTDKISLSASLASNFGAVSNANDVSFFRNPGENFELMVGANYTF